MLQLKKITVQFLEKILQFYMHFSGNKQQENQLSIQTQNLPQEFGKCTNRKANKRNNKTKCKNQ